MSNHPRVIAAHAPARAVAGLAAAAALLVLAMPVLAARVDIGLTGKSFEPSAVTVHPDDTVVWTVTGAIGEPHSVTSGRPDEADPGTLFDSGIELRENGDSFEFTFEEAGTFPYYCTVHPVEMRGEIVVAAEGGAPGEEAEGIPLARRLAAAGILAAFTLVLVGWAWLYRRVNRG